MNYENIPHEMRFYVQWVNWKREFINGKWTKVPYDSKTGGKASVSDSKTWSSYAQAVTASPNYDGIGFVFTENDPFTGIDLDDCEGDAQIQGIQDRIYERFVSYAELSPSGKGRHIIVWGSLPSGKRRGKIEAYSSGRFFTMTGNVIRNAPIHILRFCCLSY